MTVGAFGLGAGAASYATPDNHGPANSFICGSNMTWMPPGAGVQASYDVNRTAQIVVRTNGSLYCRWLQAGSETSITDAPWTQMQSVGTSDINFKHVNGDLDVADSLENICQMEFKRFYYLDDDEQTERRGVIAQQIEQIDKQYVHSAEGVGKMTLDLNPLMMDALAAIKALNAKVAELSKQVDELKQGGA
ncbi:TPA: tail fiber domain-containing protein [Enterobacter cloacae]|nr:tail fiber domain-containing protein [Enterobacter cloacae]HEB0967751.1 tail fiber domain-containing protein [Enterobacter cloacae]